MNAAPPESYFEGLAKDIIAGNTVNMDHATKKNDKRKMKAAWCLHEALVSIDRAFLRTASSICLFRDERQSRLLLRFRAVRRDLIVKSGILGQVRDFGTGSTSITEATLKVINNMCTNLRDCKHNQSRQVRPQFDRELYDHILNITHMITVDAASDEVLSAEMMRSERLWKEHTKLFKNLRFILRDKTHGSRRSPFLFCCFCLFFFDGWLLLPTDS